MIGSDASRFQYLMQILQVQFQHYVPKYHIFVDDAESINVPIQTWHEPTTLWDGQPVLGFMAETFLDDLHSWFQGLQSDVDISNVQFQDYVPKYHIFVDDAESINVPIQTWHEPTTLWDGQPVLGFMAETFLDDLHSWFQGLQIRCGHFQQHLSINVGNR